MSKNVRELLIEDITVDPDLQPRAEMDDEVIDEYLKHLDELPPVIVYFDGKRYHWLAAGFHRLAAHRKAGRTRIRAEVRQGKFDDALLFAAGDNATHGLRRSNRDKERAATMLLNHPVFGKKPSRWIAERVGVSHTFVDNLRKRPEQPEPLATVTTSQQDTASTPAAAPEPQPAGVATVANAPAPQPAPKPAGEPRIIRDSLGLEVGPDKRLIFTETVRKFEAVLLLARQLARHIDELAKMPGGELVRRRCEMHMHDSKESFRATQLNNLISNLVASEPHVGCCPSCKGAKSPCLVCRDLGWITEEAWQNLPASVRQDVMASMKS